MIVRPIVPEEIQSVRDLFNIAFAFAREPGDPPAIKPDEHVNTRAAFDDAGKMTAALELVPFTVWYEGQAVGMGGIGGVSSLPESRRQGNIRALMELSLREMYERGMVLSALYPFSHAYYRQFGYELCCIRRRVQVDFDAFAGFRCDDPVRQWMPGEDDAPIRELYEAFAQAANLPVKREDSHWKHKLGGDPCVTRKYIYLWSDAQGQPSAYAILRAEDVSEGKQLVLDDFACRQPSALRGMFALLRNMGAAYRRFVWKMPPWIDPNTIYPEPYNAEQHIEQAGMARVVNVGEALRLLRHPQEPGSYALRVRDAQLPQNEGVWQVCFDGGEVKVEKKAEGQADWTLDIRALSQLALGYHDVDSLAWAWPALEAPANADTLRRVFRRRRVYLADFF